MIALFLIVLDTPSTVVGFEALHVSAQQPSLSTGSIQSFAEGCEANAELAPETARTVD
ncbi:hypothetical protein C1752_04533 [Acaryochloris thomasi RCC1774]|uniref:Uncharacterized protein n=1 Tax=Acaryochloris thomasi RCC1774 TaxID=1764569 RepID=A0A2W1JS37_9CYAN|nr:hypothetical protein C1752_04533 [Acaryochloris thomasi RCC1774]